MYLARFSCDLSPVNREQAVQLIRREVAAAHASKLHARLLVPLTRMNRHGSESGNWEWRFACPR